MLASLSGPEVDWPSGSEQEIAVREAWRLVDAGFAEWVGEPPARPEPLAAVEPEAEPVAEVVADSEPAPEPPVDPAPEPEPEAPVDTEPAAKRRRK